MAKINGSAILISSFGLPIAASTGCEITIDADEIPISGQTQGKVNERKAGLKGWKVTVDSYYLLTRSNVMATQLMDGTLLEVKISLGNKYIYGKAYASDYDVNGNTKQKVTAKLTLVGTGALADTPYGSTQLSFAQAHSTYKIAGHEMILYAAETKVVYLTNTRLSLSMNLREVAPTSTGWRQYLPERYAWTISADGLIDSSNPGTGTYGLTTGATFDAIMRIGLDKYVGDCLVTSSRIGGPLKQKATCSITAKGTTTLSVVLPESEYFDYELGFTM